MSYSDLLEPRPEVLSEQGIEGIIDLANLDKAKKKTLESNPKRFFELTYPTADIRRVISLLDERFTKEGNTPGLFLFEGLKGTGKSHLLLLIYHLLNSPSEARKWLERYDMKCSIPEGIISVVNKFTDLPLRSIWDFMFERLGKKGGSGREVQPGLKEMEEILGDNKVFLIFDELEQGIRVLRDGPPKAQNIAFLQMLSEWGNRENKVTLFASIYSDQEEPGSTFKRVPCCKVQFSQTEDRNKVVLHRLFSNYLDFDLKKADGVIESYANAWRPHIKDLERYRVLMNDSYPFNSDVMELLLERVPARGGFQNVRGALGFLANMVKLTHQKVDLITASHASLFDKEVTTRLGDLDVSGDLINKAKGNLDDLKDQPFAEAIASATLLYTLTGSGKTVGASKEDLIRNVLSPGDDINDFEATLVGFQKLASNFWYGEGRYYFDPEENPDAKVEYRCLSVDKEKAKVLLREIWRDEVFRETNCVIYSDGQTTKGALSALDKGRLRFILAPRRLKPEERHDLYFGIEARNQVILMEPKDSAFDLNKNVDLLKWACRQLAAKELESFTSDADRKANYQKIFKEDRKYCIEAVRKAGLTFVHWEKFGTDSSEDKIEEETVSGSMKDDVQKLLSQNLFPIQFFEEHLKGRITELNSKTVKEIDQDYKGTLGFPVLVYPQYLTRALRNLSKDRMISISHTRGNFCGEDPPLSETELMDATVNPPIPNDVGKKVIAKPEGRVEIEKPKTEVEPEIKEKPKDFEERDVKILPQPTIGDLRKEIASRLQQIGEGFIIKRVRFTIYLDQEIGDLSTYPTSLRGNLSGPGKMTVDMSITKTGDFSKGEVEKFVEDLPNISRAEYRADLKVVTLKS
jgi:hypothetical protein